MGSFGGEVIDLTGEDEVCMAPNSGVVVPSRAPLLTTNRSLTLSLTLSAPHSARPSPQREPPRKKQKISAKILSNDTSRLSISVPRAIHSHTNGFSNPGQSTDFPIWNGLSTNYGASSSSLQTPIRPRLTSTASATPRTTGSRTSSPDGPAKTFQSPLRHFDNPAALGLGPASAPQQDTSKLLAKSRSRPNTPPSPVSRPRRLPIQRQNSAPTTPLAQRRRNGLDEDTPIRAPAPTSPQNYRTRAHALSRRTETLVGLQEVATGTKSDTTSDWFLAQHRPYLRAAERAQLAAATPVLLHSRHASALQHTTLHVDFNPEEAAAVQQLARQVLGYPVDKQWRSLSKSLAKIAKKSRDGSELARRISLAPRFASSPLRHREREDIGSYLADIAFKALLDKQQVLSLKRDDADTYGRFNRDSRVSSLLYGREMLGMVTGFGGSTRRANFVNEFRKCRDDELELRAEWTNCAGDIITIAWVSNDAFICGMTEHSDTHNQQYNKPGNLALGSCSQGTLRAFPDHRIVRPIVQKGENSTDAMRQSQDPWLYTSVVSSHHDPVYDRAYTSSFDRTVKAWKVKAHGSGMRCIGTWKHEGNVNFVVANKDSTDLVATAADVAAAAVRVYALNGWQDTLSACPYTSYSCPRILDLEGNPIVTDKWGYFPATLQWGLAEGWRHYLLVGYSPRSLTDDENDIPEEKLDSGQICLWNALTGQRIKISTGTTQNVFEVAWHPSQPSFIAATSKPHGLNIDHHTKTQIRIFRPSDDFEVELSFSEIKTLDCAAIDINELTIMPNSFSYSYITAGCTDGNCYVWDTAQGDKPIHVLRHGRPHEELLNGEEEREREDTGVKFTAWGASLDRFYTGSSDGVVKVWNIRSAAKKPLVRDLLEVPAQVSYGMFSPDMTKLVIGDASGRVFLLSMNEDDEITGSSMKLHMPTLPTGKKVRRPRALIPHPEPEPSEYDAAGRPYQREEVETGAVLARRYIARRQLRLHNDPTIGVVQGEEYSSTGLFRIEAHLDDDPSNPLFAAWTAKQQELRKQFPTVQRFQPIRPLTKSLANLQLHERNLAQDLDPARLPRAIRLALQMDGVDLDVDNVDYGFSYEDQAWLDGSDESSKESEDEDSEDEQSSDAEIAAQLARDRQSLGKDEASMPDGEDLTSYDDNDDSDDEMSDD